MMYSIITTIGPLRGLMSSARCGSRNRFSGSRFSAVWSGNRTHRPMSAPTSISAAEESSATSGPCASAMTPQIQLPSAMPPKVAIW